MTLCRSTLVGTALLCALAAGCSSSPNPQQEPPAPVRADDGPVPPSAQDAAVVANPTSPADEAGSTPAWPSAPLMSGVKVAANRDSAVLVLPAVEGARDYRAYRLPAGVKLESVDAEHARVVGTELYCAGYRQQNDKASADLLLLRQLEVADLQGPTTLVVEAIDQACPFPGVRGAVHAEVDANSVELEAAQRGTFPVRTAQEIAAEYGSLIVNGHGAGPLINRPAPANAPRVLARTAIRVTPLGNVAMPDATLFEDFHDASESPRFVSTMPDYTRSQRAKLFQNSRFSFYTYGAEEAQFYVDRGQLHTVLADWGQDIFASNVIYPRRALKLTSDTYLHVGYEVASDATARRYWWLAVCGAAAAGETMGADGRLKGDIVQTPFFYQPDGLNPSIPGWNCLQVFPRDGMPFPLGNSAWGRTQSDVRVMVNLPDKAARESVRNVSPDQYKGAAEPGWFRQQTGAGAITGVMLDDQMLIAPRTRFDFYIRRDRVVMYVNGEQRLCNDFPNQALTMGEAAVGLGQILYHSSAERDEFSVDYNVRTGQRYYLQNTASVDVRSWDNLGYWESVAAPSGFREADCYRHPG